MMQVRQLVFGVFFSVAALWVGESARADEMLVAVAANFAKPMEQLAADFAQRSGHSLKVSTGSSGNFVKQIENGAPFAVFLSADEERPAKLEEEGHAVAGTRYTYAVGRLVLWSHKSGLIGGDPAQAISRDDVHHIAIANPDVAPYGRAAMQALKALGLWDAIQPKLVRGEDIAQTYQWIDTGNADLGFVALSQVVKDENGSRWLVPTDLYQPIRQQAVLLKAGQNNPAAQAFLSYLRSEAARSIISSFGYAVEPQS
jgi:molybdate transport system substrate-binding protein